MTTVHQKASARKPTPQETITHGVWLGIYRHMRMLRARAIHWLYRAADVPRALVASPQWLAKKLITAVDDDDPMVIDHGAMMMVACVRNAPFVGHRIVFALHLPPKAPPPSARTLAWALAALSLFVLDGGLTKMFSEEAWRAQRRLVRLDERRSETFDKHSAPLFHAFGWDAWSMLHAFIADRLVSDWYTQIEQEDPDRFVVVHRRDHFALLREERAAAALKAVA